MILKSRNEIENKVFSNINKFSQYKIESFKSNPKYEDSECELGWPICIMNIEDMYKINNHNILKCLSQPNIEEKYLLLDDQQKDKLKKLKGNQELRIHRMEHVCFSKTVRTSIIEDFDKNDDDGKEISKIDQSDDSFTSTDSDREGKIFNKYISNLNKICKIIQLLIHLFT